MKIRGLLLYAILATALIYCSGCNIFKGGGNCDCPKFGQATPHGQYLADAM